MIRNTSRRLPASLAIGAVAVLLAASAAAQSASVTKSSPSARWAGLATTVFQNYGMDQGLPHPIVMALAQDGDGFIWAGTQGGLARWDGYRFRVYTPNARDPGALPDTWIEALHTDTRGRLWVGGNTGGLARYDREHDRFIALPIGRGGLSSGHVRSIADDGAGGLWIGTGHGLDHLDPDTGAIASLHHRADDSGSLPDDRVQAVLRGRDGRLWVGTHSGLARRDPGATRFTPVPLPSPSQAPSHGSFLGPSSGPSPAATSVWTLFEDGDGRIWIGTAKQGAYVIDTPASPPRPVEESGGQGPPLASETINAIGEAGPGEIWLSTDGDGVVVVEGGTTRRIRHDPTQPTSLPHDEVSTILRDRAGSVWVGGDGGLSRHSPNNGALLTVFGGSMRPGGVSAADVNAVLPTRDGRIWLGFISGGVDIIDPAEQGRERARVVSLPPDPTRPKTALPKVPVYSMVQGEDGAVWLGAMRGLYRVDGAGHPGRIALRNPPGRDPGAGINALLIDDGALWIAGAFDGLWRMSAGAGASPIGGPANLSGLTDQRLLALQPGRPGELWVGAFNGLNRLDLASHAVERILPNPADPGGLSSGLVSSLLLDRRGRLWVGTLGGGICVLTGRDAGGRPRFRRLGLADGLPSANIGKLLLDTEGRVWASTNDGLAVIDPDRFTARALHRAEGVAIPDDWVGSGAVTAEGELLFGGQGGLTIVRPERLARWDDHPPVVATDVRIGGKPVPAGLFNGAGSRDPLTIMPDANSLAVEFAALDYTAPERNRYAYRLDGYDPDWITTDPTRRLAAYTNLPPGRYTLRVRGSNRDGVWTERELCLPVRVLPAWWQTLWFRLVLAALGVAVVLGLIQIRTAYLRQRQRQLEQQVAERTRELAISSDRLRIANAELESANAELARLAHLDPLTGLNNRRRFFELAADHLAQSLRHRRPCSVFMIDLDHFKRINDTFGHGGGDETLRATARCLLESVREVDVVARFGGEEMAVLLPETAAPEAVRVAERFREALAALEIPYEGAVIRVTASIGVASWIDGEADLEGALHRADAALYRVKAGGRDGVAAEPPIS